MRILTREDILSVQGVRTEEVPVPEWVEDGVVIVRELPAAAMTKMGMVLTVKGAATMIDDDGQESKVAVVSEISDQFPIIVAACVVDKNLNPLFTVRDVMRFASKSSAPLQRIAIKAMILSDLWEEDDDGDETADEKLIEELDEHEQVVAEVEGDEKN